MNDRVLLIEDEPIVAQAVAEGLAHCGREIVVCCDFEAAELVLDHLHPHHVVSDVRLTGPFRYEGLEILDHITRSNPRCEVVLISGAMTPELRHEATRRGASAVLEKPFAVGELEKAIGMPPGHRDGQRCFDGVVHEIPSLDEALDRLRLFPEFQPIVRIEDGSPFAFESLARFQSDSLLRRPDLLFSYAARKGRVVELEIACIARTFEEGAALASQGLLFLNIHPAVLNEGEWFTAFVQQEALRCGVDLHNVVFELTEQQPVKVLHPFLETVEALRDTGIRFAFDDVGVAYSHLHLIDRVRPSFIKVSQDFGTGFETDATRSKLVRNLLGLATEFGTPLVLEGIETPETASAARDLGITLGQGYHYARPAPADQVGRWASANPGWPVPDRGQRQLREPA